MHNECDADEPFVILMSHDLMTSSIQYRSEANNLLDQMLMYPNQKSTMIFCTNRTLRDNRFSRSRTICLAFVGRQSKFQYVSKKKQQVIKTSANAQILSVHRIRQKILSSVSHKQKHFRRKKDFFFFLTKKNYNKNNGKNQKALSHFGHFFPAPRLFVVESSKLNILVNLSSVLVNLSKLIDFASFSSFAYC